MEIELIPRQTSGAVVTQTPRGWKLEIPGGTRQNYRLAQLDDYSNLNRNRFQHVPPWSIQMRFKLE